MQYFTPELYLKLNSSDSRTVDLAMEQWERAIGSYKKHLERVRRDLPPRARSIAKSSFHDWRLRGARNPLPALALIVLEHDKAIALLSYSLSDPVRELKPPKRWPASKGDVYWLYDELDTREGTFVHRILFSDGTELQISFSSCEVTQMTAAMPHSALLQIA